MGGQNLSKSEHCQIWVFVFDPGGTGGGTGGGGGEGGGDGGGDGGGGEGQNFGQPANTGHGGSWYCQAGILLTISLHMLSKVPLGQEVID